MKNSTKLLQEDTIIVTVFCHIADTVEYLDHRPTNSYLHLSEIVLCGFLYSLKGVSFRRFYLWLKKLNLFNLPDRTSLLRSIIKHKDITQDFLCKSTTLNIADSFGIEIIHPIRESRSNQSREVSSKGKSNHRWIVGRKVNIIVNQEIRIVSVEDVKANSSDKIFTRSIKQVSGIVLCDSGYRDKEDMPSNIKIFKRGKWNERMVIESLFSLWTRVYNIKKSFHRTVNGFKSKIRYTAALINVLFDLNKECGFKEMSTVQWAL